MAFSSYARCLWSFQGALAGAGAVSKGPIAINDVTDLWLVAYASGSSSGTSPTLTVQLDVFDAFGDVVPGVLTLTAINAAPGHAEGSVGLHIASTGSRVLPASCQVTYTLGGTTPAYSSVALSLFGR